VDGVNLTPDDHGNLKVSDYEDHQSLKGSEEVAQGEEQFGFGDD
jgi:hypothetical protein